MLTGQKQIVFVGDCTSGKSALVLRLCHDLFAECYIPTRFESHSADFICTHGNFKLTLLDTSGAKEKADVRKLAYQGCDAIVLCFDLTERSSFESIELRWLPELSALPANTPIYIAGCKKDAANNEKPAISERQIQELVEKVGAAAFIECSAKTNESVEDLFQLIVEPKVQKQKRNVMKMFSSVKSTTKAFRKLYNSVWAAPQSLLWRGRKEGESSVHNSSGVGDVPVMRQGVARRLWKTAVASRTDFVNFNPNHSACVQVLWILVQVFSWFLIYVVYFNVLTVNFCEIILSFRKTVLQQLSTLFRHCDVYSYQDELCFQKWIQWTRDLYKH